MRDRLGVGARESIDKRASASIVFEIVIGGQFGRQKTPQAAIISPATKGSYAEVTANLCLAAFVVLCTSAFADDLPLNPAVSQETIGPAVRVRVQ